MAYDGTKPADGGTLAAADVRENFRALKEDGIVVAGTASIPDGAVTEGKIASAAVTAAKIGTAAVETAKIKDANVTADKLATDSVTTAKIAAANVTAAKLATNSVGTTNIIDANVTHAKLADDAVEGHNIKDASITLAKCSFSDVLTPAAGTVVVAASGRTERTTTSTSYTKKKAATIKFAGTYTVSYSYKSYASHVDAYVKVYVDGSPYGSEHTDDTGVYVNVADTVTVTAGQEIAVYLKTGSGSAAASIKNFVVSCASDPFMATAVTD